MDWMVSTFGGILFWGKEGNDQEGMGGKSLYEMEFHSGYQGYLPLQLNSTHR